VLTPLKGELTLTQAGQVIDAIDLEGCVSVQATGVVIRRSRIRCNSYYPVRVFDGANLLIEDTEIDGSPSGGIATSGIASSNYIARRLNVHGAADGLKADSNVVVEDSWIHDLWLGPGDHADGVQGTGGGNVTIRNNLIDIRDKGLGHGGAPNSCMQVGTEWDSNSNWKIEGNWFYGGGWVVHVDAGTGTGNTITGNRFGDDTAGYGPFATKGSWQVSGNVWIPSMKPAE
jgi:Right handed beta helix region